MALCLGVVLRGEEVLEELQVTGETLRVAGEREKSGACGGMPVGGVDGECTKPTAADFS